MPMPSATPATSRLVDEPMSVMLPPRMATKESGIRNRLAAMLAREPIAEITGSMMTTSGVLFMKADSPPAAISSAAMVVSGRMAALLASLRVTPSTAPVWNSPWPTTSSASTEIRAGLAKPASSAWGMSASAPAPSSGANWKSSIRATTAARAVTSMLMRSMAKPAMASAMIAKVAHMCGSDANWLPPRSGPCQDRSEIVREPRARRNACGGFGCAATRGSA